ncbi:MAG: polyhydroxyalkanoate granule-associated phasin [Aquabacterium sp.]|jgi:hypothetical protein|uniref:polyhydroxyalkanoate granule-associated phasin n=1 Tax=Aquabacterium sp. TaxID=1872578 RepID=UPI003BAE193B
MSSTRKARSLATQTAELALATPQVMAHRLTRMALAGATPSARDRKEFHLMGAEKVAAFQESWMAMAMQAWRAQMQMQTQLWTSAMQAMWMPWSRPASFGGGSALAQWQKATLGILGQGMAPVHRRAVGNAKRLGRTRLR